jgi:NhaA family Na+:H+ antiporter
MSQGGGAVPRRRVRTTAAKVRSASFEFAQYLRTETIGGMVLLGATALALVAANSPLSDAYADLRNTAVGPESLHLALTIGDWAKDGLLAVFFFVAGLELKRELVVGELRDRRQALLPVFAALGGMLGPALLCLAIAAGEPGAGRAWPVPVATDIAFALAVLAITASRLPSSVRLFLLSLAVVDDLGAIALIAGLYTEDISWLALGAAAALLLLYRLLQYGRIRSSFLYVPIALATWAAVHEAGIHATIAGVALGLLTRVTHDAGEHESPGERLEHRLQPVSAGVCVPVFAFFAAGIPLDGAALRGFTGDRIAWAVVIGLVVGKLVGVLGGAMLSVALRLAKLPDDLHWRDLAAVSVLAGCGFTVSLLITELAFAGTDQVERIKMAVLVGSLTASLLAAGLLHLRVRARDSVDAA